MKFEWDETKCQQNTRIHGLNFEDVASFDWDAALYIDDTRGDYGERREIAYGWLGSRLTVLVFTQRGDITRIISWRRANKREERFYEEVQD